MADTKIQVMDNGPILVTGSFEVVDADGNAFILDKEGTAALCRCGQSKEKPLCDGAHRACGFQAGDKAP